MFVFRPKNSISLPTFCTNTDMGTLIDPPRWPLVQLMQAVQRNHHSGRTCQRSSGQRYCHARFRLLHHLLLPWLLVSWKAQKPDMNNIERELKSLIVSKFDIPTHTVLYHLAITQYRALKLTSLNEENAFRVFLQ